MVAQWWSCGATVLVRDGQGVLSWWYNCAVGWYRGGTLVVQWCHAGIVMELMARS